MSTERKFTQPLENLTTEQLRFNRRENLPAVILSAAIGFVLGADAIADGFLKNNAGYGVLGGLIAIAFLGGSVLVLKDAHKLKPKNPTV